jgi:hypothetical protein
MGTRAHRRRNGVTHQKYREGTPMLVRRLIRGAAAAAALAAMIGGAAAFDDTKYPDLKGQWRRAGNVGLLAGGAGGLRYDESKPPKAIPSLGRSRR